MNFDNVIQAISNVVISSESEYMGEDGFLHCAVCHSRTQTKINLLGSERVVKCICDCKRKEREAEEEKTRRAERERLRKICFSETNMSTWTFENDHKTNLFMTNAMVNYVDNFEEFKKDGKGLLLCGDIGTGKTYFAACIANRLIDKGYRVLMTNFARLSNQIQGTFERKQEIIDDINRYPLLILDDLGAERKSGYMLEMVFNIIDSRYRTGLPFIVTTNVPLSDFKGKADAEYMRIYDRILERCFPIEFKGESKRRESIRKSYVETKQKLGL